MSKHQRWSPRLHRDSRISCTLLSFTPRGQVDVGGDRGAFPPPQIWGLPLRVSIHHPHHHSGVLGIFPHSTWTACGSPGGAEGGRLCFFYVFGSDIHLGSCQRAEAGWVASASSIFWGKSMCPLNDAVDNPSYMHTPTCSSQIPLHSPSLQGLHHPKSSHEPKDVDLDPLASPFYR